MSLEFPNPEENSEHQNPIEHFDEKYIPQPEHFDMGSVGPKTEEEADELRQAIQDARRD